MLRHTFGQFEGTGLLIACGTVTGGTGALTNVSGPLAQAADITCSRGGTGTYTITLNPFKGPLGRVNVVITPGTADRAASITSKTYTGDSLAIAIKTRSIAGSPADTDSDFDFEVKAY